MHYAAENGYDNVAFINGAQSAERYDLSKQIGSVSFTRNAHGVGKVSRDEGPGMLSAV